MIFSSERQSEFGVAVAWGYGTDDRLENEIDLEQPI